MRLQAHRLGPLEARARGDMNGQIASGITLRLKSEALCPVLNVPDAGFFALRGTRLFVEGLELLPPRTGQLAVDVSWHMRPIKTWVRKCVHQSLANCNRLLLHRGADADRHEIHLSTLPIPRTHLQAGSWAET